MNETFSKLTISVNNLPFDKMMPADKEFFPLILNGKKILVESYYSPFQIQIKLFQKPT